MSSKLNKFTAEVAQYQSKYPWLLLINMPKILLLKNLLHNLRENNALLFGIICELTPILKDNLRWDEIVLVMEVII